MKNHFLVQINHNAQFVLKNVKFWLIGATWDVGKTVSLFQYKLAFWMIKVLADEKENFVKL